MDRKYKLVIFDMDGTILNTLVDLNNALNYTLDKMGYPQCSIEDTRMYVGNGILKTITRAFPKDTSIGIIEMAHKIFTDYYRDHCNDNTAPYEGINLMIKELRKKGILTAVVSNKADYAVGILCEKMFDGLFDLYVGEKEGVKRKPAPDMVDIVLRELKISREEAVYIGDSDVDFDTAKNSGLDFIGVSWGFRGRDFLAKCGAETIIDNPFELTELVTGM